MASGFLLGLSWGPYSPLLNTLVQQRIPAHIHGRVFGVQTSVFYAAPPLGMLLSGLSVENYGVKFTYAILAGVLSFTSIFVLLTKSLRAKF
jgi:MFS family permease